MLDPTPREALTSLPPSTTEVSNNDRGEDTIDVTLKEEWLARLKQRGRP